MATSTTDVRSSIGRGVPAPRLILWLKLIAGFVLVWAAIFVFGSLAAHIPGADHMAKVIDERELRATAIYYTDLEESFEGSEYIRHALESRKKE